MTKINRVVLSVYASRIFARSRHLPQPRYDIFKRSETWNSSLRCIKFCETKTPRTKRTIHRNCYWEVKKIRQRRREIWKGYTLPKLNEAGRRWVCKYEFHFVFSKPVGHSSHSLLPVAPLRFLKCSSLSGAYKTVTSKSNTIIFFLFKSVSFKHMYQILYFIFHRYKLLSTPSILSAIHVRSAIGDLSTIIRS